MLSKILGKKYLVFLLLFVVIIIALTVFGDKGLIRIYRLSQERDSLKNENRKIMAENAEMKEEIHRLKTDDKYIELIARKEFGMIGKDEVFYQFEK